MTAEELGALVDAETRTAVGFGGKLAEQRKKAEYYYAAEAKEDLAPPSIPGRSRVVVPVFRNTVEAMLPQLMLKFTGGDTVVEFEPTDRGDEEKAKQATDYCNYLFFKKNNGHSVTYSWFKDALKFKRGIVKVWWDNRDEEKREEYRGMSDVELAQLMDDPEIEVTEQKSYPDEEDAKQRADAVEQLTQQLGQAQQAAQQGSGQALQAVMHLQAQLDQIGQTPAPMLFDVTCTRTKSGGKICIENVPPEEFGISRKAKMDLQDAPAVMHRTRRTKSDLLSMGYKKSLIESLGNDTDGDESAERNARLDDGYDDRDDGTGDESQRQYWVTECYLRCDYDGDGIAELRKVTRCGGKTLDNEVVDIIPFVSICPVPEPHKFFGLSIFDLAMEGQRTETAILRSTLDNLYLEVNGRYFAVENQVNLDDLLSSRPGGVVRVKAPGMVGRLDQGKGSLGESMSMMEFMKGFNEDSTGWSRQSQGNDPSGLKPETATKANIVTNKADMRVDLIARNFAEGFEALFRMMLKLVCQYQNKAAQVRLSGQWVSMDPREWRNGFDCSINVGLGVGSKDQQIAHLMALQQAQGSGLQIGIATPQNLYESSSELAKAMGFKSADKFFTKPDPSRPPPNPAAAEAQAAQSMEQAKMQGQMQVEQMKLQATSQVKQMELQQAVQLDEAKRQHETAMEQAKMQMQQAVDANRQEMEARQKSLESQQQAQLDGMKMQGENERHARDIAFNEWKAKLDAETKILVAQIGAHIQPEAEQEPDEPEEPPPGPDTNAMLADALHGISASMQGVASALVDMRKPRRIVRGADGRAEGLE